MKSRSQVVEERRQKRVRVVMSVVLVLLLVFSTIGFYFTGSGTTQRYNGVKLEAQVNSQGIVQGYNAKLAGKELFFYSHPQDSLSISVPSAFGTALQSSQGIVWVFSPSDNATAIFDQLRYDFSLTMSLQQGAGVSEAGSGAYESFPLVACNQSMPGYMFIKLQTGERAITYDDGCFVVSGSQYDWPLLRDRILYLYYGITKEEAQE